MLLNNPIKVEITKKAKFKLDTYYSLANKEVGGLFEIESDKKNNVIKIVDTIILDQQVTGGDFKLEEDDLSKFTKEIFFKSPDKMDKFKGWWHKHPITGWSGQDDATFSRLRDTYKGSIIGLVMQGNGKILSRVDLKTKKMEMTLNTLNLKIVEGEKFNAKEVKKECEKLFKEKVKEYKYVPSKEFGKVLADYDYNFYKKQGKENPDWWKGTSFDVDQKSWKPRTVEDARDEAKAVIWTNYGQGWEQYRTPNEKRVELFDKIHRAITDVITKENCVTTLSIDSCAARNNCLKCEFRVQCIERKAEIQTYEYYD